jgi:hypothetical protein
MSGKWMFRLWMTVGAICVTCSMANAATPWGNLISTNSVDADPNKAYNVSEENGPWMIMATSFSGEGAEKQAKELVLELRKRYKIPAYIYQKRFDPGEAQARGVDKYGRPKKANYFKYKDSKDREKARHPELVEIAVVAGDYSSAGDKKAQATLQTLKYARPQCLELKEGKATNQTLTGWRYAQQQIYEAIGSEKKDLGPMRHAFIIPNPLLPPEFFNQQSLDEETVAMNKDVPHSLLGCPGKFTVQIATFKGNAVIKQNEIQDIQQGRKEMKSQLAVAAQRAHDLTIYLREKGYDAYQFHDRFTSIVTVGSFNSPGRMAAEGQFEIDPGIKQVIDFFCAKESQASLNIPRAKERRTGPDGRPEVQQAMMAHRLDSQTVSLVPESVEIVKGELIPFDVQPVVIRVPKRAISSVFSRDE